MLQQALQEITQEHEALIDQLNCLERQLDPATSEWLSGILSLFSHDFNNRLASVLLMIDLLDRKHHHQDEEMLARLREQLRDLQNIVKEMRARTQPCDYSVKLP